MLQSSLRGSDIGDSLDYPLTEIIHRRIRKNRNVVETATLDWMDRFTCKRLVRPIEYITPMEAEADYHQQRRDLALVA